MTDKLIMVRLCKKNFRSCVPSGFVCPQLSRLMPLLRYAVKPTRASDFIAPLVEGIGSHDCTPFRKSTVTSFRFHYSIAFIS
jgi:hypothetical protein